MCSKTVAVADAMKTPDSRPAADTEKINGDDTSPVSTVGGNRQQPLSMHDNVQVWDDCCSCEAEPYWLEAMHKSEGESSDDEK
jgi:hypothetical protein